MQGHDATITNNGNITANSSFNRASGIKLTNFNATITNKGNITTTNSSYATAATSLILMVRVSQTSQTTVVLQLALPNAKGIFITYDNATVMSSGSIEAYSVNSHVSGIKIYATNAVITNSGNITACGTSVASFSGSSFGIYANGSASTVTHSGRIAVSGGASNVALVLAELAQQEI